MFFTSPMCIFCKRKTRNTIIEFRGAAVCGACFDDLPFTAQNQSFQPFGKKNEFEYLISPFFYDGDLRDAVLEYKFFGCFRYADIFADLMKRSIDAEHLKTFDMMIPVPLSKKRMTERGYNQSALIAKPLAESLNVEYREDILIRTVETKRQSGLAGLQRKTNVEGAFKSKDVSGKSIIVFDDIYTTGCTLNECAKTLKSAGADKVIGLTLSVTPKGLETFEERFIRFFK